MRLIVLENDEIPCIDMSAILSILNRRFSGMEVLYSNFPSDSLENSCRSLQIVLNKLKESERYRIPVLYFGNFSDLAGERCRISKFKNFDFNIKGWAGTINSYLLVYEDNKTVYQSSYISCVSLDAVEGFVHVVMGSLRGTERDMYNLIVRLIAEHV